MNLAPMKLRFFSSLHSQGLATGQSANKFSVLLQVPLGGIQSSWFPSHLKSRKDGLFIRKRWIVAPNPRFRLQGGRVNIAKGGSNEPLKILNDYISFYK